MNRFANIAGILLTACTMYASAQPFSSIKAASDIYEGCMNGSIHGLVVGEEYTDAEITQFINHTDENCIKWMLVWFKPIVGDAHPDITEWNIQDIGLLTSARRFFLMRYERSIRYTLKP